MYVDTNRELWNLWTKLNAASKECSDLLLQLKAGRTTLEKVELEELDDVAGKTLLHLQCHFGLPTEANCRPTCAGADQAISA